MNALLFRLAVAWRILWVCGIIPGAITVLVAVLRWLVPGGRPLSWALTYEAVAHVWVGILIGYGAAAEFNRHLFRWMLAGLIAAELLAFGAGRLRAEDPSYRACWEAAQATRMPMIVYVRCEPKNIPGTIQYRTPNAFAGVQSGVIVAIPAADWFEWRATLPPDVSAAKIMETWAAPLRKWNPYAPTLQIRDAMSASC